MKRFLVAFLILVQAGAWLAAQTAPPDDPRRPGGNPRARRGVDIQGRVVPRVGESTVPELMTVTLTVLRGGFFQTQLVRSGIFQFKGVPVDTYMLELQCNGFQTVRERLDLRDMGASSIEFVQINLGERLEESSSGPPPDQTIVSARRLKIPDRAVELFQQAHKASTKQKYQKAVSLLQKAIEAHPDFPEAHNLLAVQHIRLQQEDRAIQALTHSLQLSESAEAHQNLGAIYLYSDRIDLAREHLLQAHQVDGDDGKTIRLLGEADFRRGEFESARQWFEKVQHEEDPMVDLAMGHCYLRLGSYPEALRYFERFLKTNPQGPQAQSTRQIVRQLRRQ